VESKTTHREARQEGRYAKKKRIQGVSQASLVSKKTKQGAEADGGYPSWVEESIWTERMLTVLGNGMKGGKWFSLMDKAPINITTRMGEDCFSQRSCGC
jgi:hypothetical protein